MTNEQEGNVIALFESNTCPLWSRSTTIVGCPYKHKPSCDSVMEMKPTCASTHTSDALTELNPPSCLHLFIGISYCILVV